MYEITNKQILSDGVKRIDVYAPEIVRHIQPGQFVSVCPEEGDERIPLSVVETDQTKQTITLIFQEVGSTTMKLGSLPMNEPIFSILGPLGVATDIQKYGNVVCVATGVGVAQILSVCRALKAAGNKVTGIIGAQTKKKLLLEAQMRLTCNRIFVATNDGSYERKAKATDIFKEILDKKEVDFVYAIGSTHMMSTICELTQPKNIPTRVYLNPVMLDCTGMCGACRVNVGGRTVLACLEGPEFDGHLVDFDDYRIRMNAFKELDTWEEQRQKSSPQVSEPKTLTRLLSGILKK